ncbi:hypothetical protein Vretimale_3815 [Volvox reticuliferus]|uniref:CRAL-TRIO domain-containing protein n=1 Tax=Volvox reticuliferus TaxID=1737510 RepID=A0A8J4DFX3_9CHLO|nr:hypothetical protein Vretimale_3815 [Volvox reticuliferus]
METPLDNLQPPARTDDSELGYAPRYRQSAESSDDVDEPLAYKMQYNSVYNLTNELAGGTIYSSGCVVDAHAASQASNDLNSALDPAVAFIAPGSGTMQPVGSDNSDDEDSLNRIAGYTRSASLSARTAVETAAAIAARTAALSERLSFRARAESEQQVPHTQISTGLTACPQTTSVATNSSNLNAGTATSSTASIAATDAFLAAENSPSSNVKQEGPAGEDPAAALFQGTVPPVQAWHLAQQASMGLPQAPPVPDPHQSLPVCEVLVNHADFEAASSSGIGYIMSTGFLTSQRPQLPARSPKLLSDNLGAFGVAGSVGEGPFVEHGSGSYLAAGDGTQLQQLVMPPDKVEPYVRNPMLPSAQTNALVGTVPGAPSVLHEEWAPASTSSDVPSAPPTWRKSDLRSFEDVSLDLATGSAAGPCAWQAHSSRQSGTGSEIGTVELPLDAPEVVATVEHPVFDDPDVLPHDHTVPHLKSEPLTVPAAAAGTQLAISNADQLLDGYRIAAAAGLVSPELASLLGLAPPPAEDATAAGGRQNLLLGEEGERGSLLKADGVDDLISKGGPGAVGAELAAGLVPQPEPLASMGSGLQVTKVVEGGPGAAVPAVAVRKLSSAAVVQHDTAGDPFDAADTDDEAAGFMVKPSQIASGVPASGLGSADMRPRYSQEREFVVPRTTAVAQELPYAMQPDPHAGVEAQISPQTVGTPAAAVAAAAAGIGLTMVGGVAVAAAAAADQRAVAVVRGQQQPWHGPANGAISVSGPPRGVIMPAGQAGPQPMQQQQQPQFFPPPPYVRPPAPGGPCSQPGLTLPTSIHSSASPTTALEPHQPPHQPPQGPQLHPTGPPPHPAVPGFGFGPQANFPAGRGAPGAPLPSASAANSVAPGAPPLLAPHGGAPWPQGGPGSGPYGPGLIPRPGLPLRPLMQPQPQPGVPHGATRQGIHPPPGQGLGPVRMVFPQGQPGPGLGPGVRPPFNGGTMAPQPVGPVGTPRPPLAPGAAGPRPPHAAVLPPPKPSPYPGLLYTEGRDTLGRPVVVLNTAMLPAKAKKNDVLQHLLQELQPVVQGDYVIVVLSLAMGVKASSVSSTWALGAYRSLAKPYRKNVKHIVLVQPTAWARTLLALAQPFVSKKAAHKVKKVDNLVQISDATGGEVKLESLGGRFIREIQYGLGAPPLAGLVPTPGPGVSQRPPVPGPMVPPPRGAMPPGHPAPLYQGPPGPYIPSAPRPMPPGSSIATPVYGPGGPGPATAGRTQGPPPPRPQFPPSMSGPGGVGGGPQLGRGNELGAAVPPPGPR